MNTTTPCAGHTPEYSTKGPVWTVCPMETYVECEVGTVIVWLVVDLDFDHKNYCGKSIAECAVESEARSIANALNNQADLWKAATQALAQLEKHDAGTADAIRAEFKTALAAARA